MYINRCKLSFNHKHMEHTISCNKRLFQNSVKVEHCFYLQCLENNYYYWCVFQDRDDWKTSPNRTTIGLPLCSTVIFQNRKMCFLIVSSFNTTQRAESSNKFFKGRQELFVCTHSFILKRAGVARGIASLVEISSEGHITLRSRVRLESFFSWGEHNRTSTVEVMVIPVEYLVTSGFAPLPAVSNTLRSTWPMPEGV